MPSLMIGGFPPKLYGNPELPREKLLAPRITGLVPLPYCLEPYCIVRMSPARTFFLSRGGSLRARMTMDPAVGTTETLAWRFCTISLTVMRSPFQSLAVSLAMSSPTFLGERPKGPILGARDEAAPTSPRPWKHSDDQIPVPRRPNTKTRLNAPPVTLTNTSIICKNESRLSANNITKERQITGT